MFNIQTIIDSATYDLFNKVKLKPQTIVSITYYFLNDHSMMHAESEDITSNYLTVCTNFTNNLSL